MFRPGGVLWLDLGGAFGWAYGHAGETPLAGVYDLPSLTTGIGRRCGAFENALLELLGQFRPTFVGIEAHMPAKHQKSEAAAVSAIGLYAVASVACWRNDVRSETRAVDTVRSSVIGRCRLTEQERAAKLDVKDAIVRPWIDHMGWKIHDHNARDAAVGWAYDTGIRARKTK
jgi:hypothetical protein